MGEMRKSVLGCGGSEGRGVGEVRGEVWGSAGKMWKKYKSVRKGVGSVLGVWER